MRWDPCFLGVRRLQTPMYFGVTSCLLNIVLDLLLVGVFHMDVEGAAIARSHRRRWL